MPLARSMSTTWKSFRASPKAAKEEKAPLILQVSAGARKYANHTYLMKLIEAAR